MRYLIFLILFLSLQQSFSQNIERLKAKLDSNKWYQIAANPFTDSTYIGKYSERYVVNPFLGSKVFRLEIKDSWGFGNPITYKPNTGFRLGIAGGYKGFRIGLSLPVLRFVNIYGKTKSFTLYLTSQLSFLNWGINAFFVRNKGFYLSNPKGIVPGWQAGDPYPLRPDIRTLNIGLSSHMVFSKKFSMKAAWYLSEKQKKSAGGFSLGGTMRFSRVAADSSFIPPTQYADFKDIATLTDGNFLTMAMAPGYSYTAVYHDFFLSGMALLGLGFQFQAYHLSKSKLSPGFKLNSYSVLRFSAGYNTRRYFAALSYEFTNNKAIVKSSKFNFAYSAFLFNAGIRFD